MASMHFWGVEVDGKEPTFVKVEEGQVIHISQATLGELKKVKESVIIHLTVGDKKLVMGLLNQNTPQISLDLVLDQDFEISHNWKNGCVHFLGYDSDMPEELFSDVSEDDEDEDIRAALSLKDNGKLGKPGASAAEKAKKDSKVKPVQKMEKADEDSIDDDDDSEDDDDSDSELDKFGDSEEDDDDEDSSDEDGSDSSDEEETPKPDSPKKRSKANVKTPEAKKAKVATPQKTDGKKGGAHTATPHPSKKAGKSGEKSSPKPKSGGKLSCGSCSKTFNNETGLQAHTKAKHAK